MADLWRGVAGVPEPVGPVTGAEMFVLEPALALAALVVRFQEFLPSSAAVALMALALLAMALVLLHRLPRRDSHCVQTRTALGYTPSASGASAASPQGFVAEELAPIQSPDAPTARNKSRLGPDKTNNQGG